MKRILVIGQSDNPGGVEAVIKRYYEVIKHDVQMDLMVFSNKCYDAAYYKQNHCGIFFIKSAQFREPLKYKKEVKSFFKKNKNNYDVIWFNCCDLANCGYIMKQAKKYGIKKRIIHAHNNQLMQTGKRRYFYLLVHEFWKYNIDQYATDFWACSMLAGEFFYKKSILKSNRFKIIKNAIEVYKYHRDPEIRKVIRKQLDISDDCIVIGHVGRFQFQKNHELLIDIYSSLCKKYCNSRLLLVGGGVEEDNIKNKVRMLNLKKNVIFMGTQNNVHEIFQAMDVFALPSRFEGLGIVLVEAQAAGLPCVTTKSVVPESVNVTGNVEFVDIHASIEQWVEVIEKQIGKTINLNQIDAQIAEAGYDITIAGQEFKKFIIGQAENNE